MANIDSGTSLLSRFSFCPEDSDCSCVPGTAGARPSVQGLCGQAGGGAAHPKTLRTAPYREEVTGPEPPELDRSEKLSRSNCQTSPHGGGSRQVFDTFSSLTVHPGEFLAAY